MDNEYLSLGEAAELMNWSRFKLWRLVRDGKLDAYESESDRRQKLVKRSDLLALASPRPIEVDESKKEAA